MYIMPPKLGHHQMMKSNYRRWYNGGGIGGCFLPLIITITLLAEPAIGCSSRAIMKPRPTTLPSSSSSSETDMESSSELITRRPNITFPIYNCPPTYAAWYCLNDATCFTVEIHNEILYNCECASGFIGPRCEYKEIDGSYLPTRQRVMLEKASIACGATLALILMFICLSLYIRHEQKLKEANENRRMSDKNDAVGIGSGMDEIDGLTATAVPSKRSAGGGGGTPHHHPNKSLDYAFRR